MNWDSKPEQIIESNVLTITRNKKSLIDLLNFIIWYDTWLSLILHNLDQQARSNCCIECCDYYFDLQYNTMPWTLINKMLRWRVPSFQRLNFGLVRNFLWMFFKILNPLQHGIIFYLFPMLQLRGANAPESSRHSHVYLGCLGSEVEFLLQFLSFKFSKWQSFICFDGLTSRISPVTAS